MHTPVGNRTIERDFDPAQDFNFNLDPLSGSRPEPSRVESYESGRNISSETRSKLTTILGLHFEREAGEEFIFSIYHSERTISLSHNEVQRLAKQLKQRKYDEARRVLEELLDKNKAQRARYLQETTEVANVLSRIKEVADSWNRFEEAFSLRVIGGERFFRFFSTLVLAGKNVFLHGEPGTGKTYGVDSFFQAIKLTRAEAEALGVRFHGEGEQVTSYLEVVTNTASSAGDLIADLDMVAMNKGKGMRRLWKQGPGGHLFVKLDEVDKPPAEVIGLLLEMLGERTITHGGLMEEIMTKSFALISNLSVTSLLERGYEQVYKPFFSRVGGIWQEFNMVSRTERRRLIRGEARGVKPEIAYGELVDLQKLIPRVEVSQDAVDRLLDLTDAIEARLGEHESQDLLRHRREDREFRRGERDEPPTPAYRRSIRFNTREEALFTDLLMAIAVQRWVSEVNRGRVEDVTEAIEVTMADIEFLALNFMIENGPESSTFAELRRSPKINTNHQLLQALDRLEFERGVVREALEEVGISR
jgi:MoxR-like ATPase